MGISILGSKATGASRGVAKEELVVQEEEEAEVIGMTEEELKDALRSENPYIKTDAIAYLESNGSERAIMRIQELLFDDSASVVIEAALALGRTSKVGAVKDLVYSFQQNRVRIDGYGEAIRESIIYALGQIGSEEAVPLLGEEFFAQGTLVYRDHIVDALAKIGGRESAYYLEQYLNFLLENPPSDDWKAFKSAWKQAVDKVENTIAFIAN